MSKIIPEQSSFIIIGAWNPAIIQPFWLKKQFPNLFPKTVAIHVDVTSSPLVLKIELDDFLIIPQEGRLTFVPKKVTTEILETISTLSMGICEKLIHTPITAAGSNVAFKLEDNENCYFEEIDDKTEEITNNLVQLPLISKSVKLIFSRKTHNLLVNYDNSNKNLLFNYEFQSPTAMKDATDSLIDNFNHAQEMSKRLIKK